MTVQNLLIRFEMAKPKNISVPVDVASSLFYWTLTPLCIKYRVIHNLMDTARDTEQRPVEDVKKSRVAI